MKKLLALTLVLSLVVLLSACGRKEMQMLWWDDGTEGQVMQELLDRYEEETGVVIELVTLPYNDYETRLRTMINGGEAPALARVTEGHLNNFKEFILSLEDVYDQSNFTNHFYNEDGESISLPLDITANGLFLNLDLLNEHGIDYPTLGDVWTWDEFVAEFSKLKDVDGVAAPGVFDHQAHRFMPLMYQHGITLWDTPYTSSNLTSDEAVAALTMLQEFYADGFIEEFPLAQSSNAATLFRTGNYGFHMSGNWNVTGHAGEVDFEWTVVPMPYVENRATILGGKSMAAFADSGMEQEALDFIAWLAEPAQHDYFTQEAFYLTPRFGAEVDYGEFADEYAVFLDEIAATDERFVQDWLTQVMIPGMYPIINDLVEDAAEGQDVLTLLQALEARLKEIME